MFRFTTRDILWLTMAVALAVGWWVDHGSTNKLVETLRSELSSAKSGEQMFLQSSWQFRRNLEALRAVLHYKHSGQSPSAGEEVIWNNAEPQLAFDVVIPKRHPSNGVIPSNLKPAFNCLGAIIVGDRGHIPTGTGLMRIHDSRPSGLGNTHDYAIRVATSKDTARIIMPDVFRSFLDTSEQYYIVIYGGWRDDTTTFAAKHDQLDVKWEIFSLRRLSIVP